MQSRRLLMPTVAVSAPCIFGIVGMIHGDIPVGIWAQNPVFIAVFTLAACVVKKAGLRVPARTVVAASALLIGLTFREPDIDGVHRWLCLPGFTLNAAAVVLPACVAALTRLAGERQAAWCAWGIAFIGLLLYMQPDASQLLAFALPMLVLLIGADIHGTLKWSLSGILALLPLLSWLPDSGQLYGGDTDTFARSVRTAVSGGHLFPAPGSGRNDDTGNPGKTKDMDRCRTVLCADDTLRIFRQIPCAVHGLRCFVDSWVFHRDLPGLIQAVNDCRRLLFSMGHQISFL